MLRLAPRHSLPLGNGLAQLRRWTSAAEPQQGIDYAQPRGMAERKLAMQRKVALAKQPALSSDNSQPAESQQDSADTQPRGMAEREQAMRLDEAIAKPDLSGDHLAERFNDVNIQMLAGPLRQKVFGATKKPELMSREKARESEEALRRHGLWDKPTDKAAPIDFVLPPLLGEDVMAHFKAIGEKMAHPYLDLTKELAAATLPPMPSTWLQKPAGWIRYDAKQPAGIPVKGPAEDALVFDVEVLVMAGKAPTMATAVSKDAWYSWTSPTIFDSSKPEVLIEMPFDRPRVIVGHHVSFDRARIKDEYQLLGTENRFIDTMSVHMALSGLTSIQRNLWNKQKKKDKAQQLASAEKGDAEDDSAAPFLYDGSEIEVMEDEKIPREKWLDAGATNSLLDVHNFHCGQTTKIVMNKDQRNIFVTGTMDDVKDQFQDLMTYCATDVVATHEVLASIFPRYLKKCPHPVSFSGMLEMGSCYLPVNEGWERYIERAETAYLNILETFEKRLQEIAINALDALKTGDHLKDPWLSQLNWTVEEQKMTKAKYKKDGTYAKGGEPRPVANQRLPGYPEWFKDLCPSGQGAVPHITTRTRVTPYLLKMQWQGKYPLRYLNKRWGYIVPSADVSAQPGSNGVAVATLETPEGVPPPDPTDDSYFFPIPHKDGPDAPCGNPLAKDYSNAIQSGLLTSKYEEARQALDLNVSCGYWISTRKRVKDQYVVWTDTDKDGGKWGAILPQVIVAGTVTRRAVEATWMTASNPKKKLVGSELKAMVTAPPGWRFVGADVDSQELWISALIGDSTFGCHGATPFGWMTLQGRKSDGTDLHSKSANILGISRDHAKVFNYGRIYGAGQKYAAQLLLQFNKGLDENVAKERARDLYLSTKGERVYKDKDGNIYQRRDVFKMSSYKKNKLQLKEMWQNGSESFMFNKLEEIALSRDPRTPALKCGISDALKPEAVEKEYMTSRVNWVVQSSGVDYLHMLLVSMKWLISQHECLKGARFSISIHDEVRYMCREDQTMQVAFALQVSNLLTRAMFAYQLGIHDLPQSVAFFSGVDIDTVIRKEVNLDCVTPSSPNAIPSGKTLDITAILKGTNNGADLLQSS